MLGFMFGPEPNVSRHVEEIKRKFRARLWSVIHLKRSGFSGWDLFKLFNIYVRPIIEYCSVIYHSMLTIGQSAEIERLQKQVVKLAFRWERNYSDICEEKGILTLKERRENYIDNFVLKTLDNPRFTDTWYPRREAHTHDIRNRNPFIETRATTQRYFNSPLSYLRRRANYLVAHAVTIDKTDWR